jgi:carbon starvation protein CstA
MLVMVSVNRPAELILNAMKKVLAQTLQSQEEYVIIVYLLLVHVHQILMVVVVMDAITVQQAKYSVRLPLAVLMPPQPLTVLQQSTNVLLVNVLEK